MFFAVTFIHLHLAYIYWKWGWLSADARRMQHLRMFFLSDLRQLCRHYDLPLRETRRFGRGTKFYRNMTIVFTVGFELNFVILVGRCLYHSHAQLPAGHFFGISLLMGSLTLFGYH